MRRLLASAAAAVMLASAGLAAPGSAAAAATWNGYPLCASDGTNITITDSAFCWVEWKKSFTIGAGNHAAAVSGKTTFADPAADNTALASAYILFVNCYNGVSDGASLLFTESAARNVWPGLDASVVSRGIVVWPSDTPKTYGCGLLAELTHAPTDPAHNMKIADSSSGHYLTAYQYGDGIESPGPNGPPFTWPSPALRTIGSPDGKTEVLRADWQLAPASAYLRVVSNVRLTRCASGDYPNKCTYGGAVPSTVSVTVNTHWWQAASSSTTALCPGTSSHDDPVTIQITTPMHHATAVSAVANSWALSSSCPAGTLSRSSRSR